MADRENNDQYVSTTITSTRKRELLALADMLGVSLATIQRMAIHEFIRKHYSVVKEEHDYAPTRER